MILLLGSSSTSGNVFPYMHSCRICCEHTFPGWMSARKRDREPCWGDQHTRERKAKLPDLFWTNHSSVLFLRHHNIPLFSSPPPRPSSQQCHSTCIMPKGSLKIEYIEDKKRRFSAFSKRKTGLMTVCIPTMETASPRSTVQQWAVTVAFLSLKPTVR